MICADHPAREQVAESCFGAWERPQFAASTAACPGPVLPGVALGDHEIEVVVAEPFGVSDGGYSSRLFNAAAQGYVVDGQQIEVRGHAARQVGHLTARNPGTVRLVVCLLIGGAGACGSGRAVESWPAVRLGLEEARDARPGARLLH